MFGLQTTPFDDDDYGDDDGDDDNHYNSEYKPIGVQHQNNHK